MLVKEYNEFSAHNFDNFDAMNQFFDDTHYQNSHKGQRYFEYAYTYMKYNQ
jgi:hypothetical protein